VEPYVEEVMGYPHDGLGLGERLLWWDVSFLLEHVEEVMGLADDGLGLGERASGYSWVLGADDLESPRLTGVVGRIFTRVGSYSLTASSAVDQPGQLRGR
jgi:hypothetical protein